MVGISCNYSICLRFILIINIYLLFLYNNCFGVETVNSAITETSKDVLENYEMMKETVVTAARMEKQVHEIAANVVVIDREQIESMPATTVGEILKSIPGIHIMSWGGEGGSTAASIQGSMIHHVAVFQDGVPLNQIVNPFTDLTYLPLEIVEKIEIYKGAASSAWGSALGGVINIITRQPDKNISGNVSLSYGEHNNEKKGIGISGTKGNFGYRMSYIHKMSDGPVAHSEYDHDSFYSKLTLTGNSSKLNAVFLFDTHNNESPYPEGIGSTYWDIIERGRYYQAVNYAIDIGNNIRASVDIRHHNFDILEEESIGTIYNDYTDEIWGTSIKLEHHIPMKNSIILGIEGDDGNYEWLSEVLDTSEEGHIKNWAVFLIDTYTISDLSFNIGIRNDKSDWYGSEVSPSGGIVYHFLNYNALIRAQVSRGFSASRPELNLNPELVTNYQLGADITPYPFLFLNAAVFRADVIDLIVPVPGERRRDNIGRAERNGWECTLRLNVLPKVKMSFNISRVIVTDKVSDTEIKNIPSTIMQIFAMYTMSGIEQSITGRYIDNNSSYAETRDKVFLFDYYVKTKVNIIKKLSKSYLFLKIHNIAGTRYVYREKYPESDRWGEVGVKVMW